ncbi:hypothetical protein FSP39_004544 [Pinctada imbricata]|uniref:Cyclin N-terminal domain-containing protein 1 n=1 Tax=Pinctada imbricata TaxID=66713 RepID=A0AA88YMT1_PINIB|nr:hypothetical protein FSP39_004544 [Pinctada imbricata]
MDRIRIFGTPMEPIFNHKDVGMSPDLLQEWLVTLLNCNLEQIQSSHVDQGIFRAGCPTEIIFLTCEKLKTAPDAKYAAAEIFDSFMFKHIEDLRKHVQKSASHQKKKDWEAIMGRVVSVARAKKYLLELGHRYASESILQSEIRILKTLDFNVSPASTLVYVETILEVLGHNCPGIEVKMYHGVALRVLDLVYLKYNQVYSVLFQVTVRKEKPSDKEKQAFKNVRSDKLLLAVSVIACVVHIAEQHNTVKIVEQLSQITQIPSDDIVDLASVIIQQLNSEEDNSSSAISKPT